MLIRFAPQSIAHTISLVCLSIPVSFLVLISSIDLTGIPFGLWLAFKRDMSLHGLWIGLTVSLVYAATVGVWICLSTDWDREVQKVRERLESDKHAAMRQDIEAII